MLSDRQLLILERLASGDWFLECGGPEDLGGIMGRFCTQKATVRVSVADMNAIWPWAVKRPYDSPEYKLTDEGRKAANLQGAQP